MRSKYQDVPLQREDQYGSMRIMAIAEGYVMARRKGNAPFVVTIDEWVEIGKKTQVVQLQPVS